MSNFEKDRYDGDEIKSAHSSFVDYLNHLLKKYGESQVYTFLYSLTA